MAINVECECGKSFKVKDELAGKKVKCPACQTVNVVPEAGGDGGEDDAAPARKGGGKKKGSKTMLFAGLGAGVVVLACCCIGIGVGGFFLFFSGGPEKQIVGKWTVDMDEFKKSKDYQEKLKGMPEAMKEEITKLMANLTVEFKSDNTMSMTDPMSKKTETAKWKHVSTKDKIVTIEITYDKAQEDGKTKETGKIKVVDNDHMVMIGDSAGKPDIAMKRVK